MYLLILNVNPHPIIYMHTVHQDLKAVFEFE